MITANPRGVTLSHTQPARRGIFGGITRFDTIVLLGIGFICLTDYISAIWEIRLARSNFLTPWTLRIAGVPVAEVFVLTCFLLAVVRRLLRSRWPIIKIRVLPLDWYFGIMALVAVYGGIVGLATFSKNDYLREFLYDMRLPINLITVYILVSRIPKSAQQTQSLWRLFFVYSGLFFFQNLAGWFIWVYGFGYTPLGALGLGSLILTDAGNVAFLSYIALIGLVVLATGVDTLRVRWALGLLGLASFMILLISLRRANMVAIGLSFPLSVWMLATQRTLRRIVKFVPLVLLTVLLVLLAGFDWGKYIGGFFTLLDRTVDSTAMRYVGDQNVMLNMERRDLWWTGQGLGRRYELVIPLPVEDLSAFGANEIGQRWRHTLHVGNPILGFWLRYGVITGTLLAALPFYILIFSSKTTRRFARYRLSQVLIVVTLIGGAGTYFPVIGPIDPKNAMLTGLVFGLCSATMRYPFTRLSPRDQHD